MGLRWPLRDTKKDRWTPHQRRTHERGRPWCVVKPHACLGHLTRHPKTPRLLPMACHHWGCVEVAHRRVPDGTPKRASYVSRVRANEPRAPACACALRVGPRPGRGGNVRTTLSISPLRFSTQNLDPRSGTQPGHPRCGHHRSLRYRTAQPQPTSRCSSDQHSGARQCPSGALQSPKGQPLCQSRID